MSEVFAASSNASVFPSTYRGGDYSAGKYTSEANLTNILKCITDFDSFIITNESYTEGDTTKYKVEAVISGYYFNLLGLTENPTNKYLAIKLLDGKLVDVEHGSTTLDVGNYFKGVGIYQTAPEGCISLQITDGNKKILNASRLSGNVDNAANVSSTIGGKAITAIFESNGTTVKAATSAETCTGNAATATTATKLGNADVGSTTTPIYLHEGVATECTPVTGSGAISVSGNVISLGSGVATAAGGNLGGVRVIVTSGDPSSLTGLVNGDIILKIRG